MATSKISIDPNRAWQQVLARDAQANFVYAVASTGIFCRPACPSRRPAARNVVFFTSAADARQAGYRACLRCAPDGTSPDQGLVARLCEHLARNQERNPERTVTLAELAQMAGESPFTVQRKFRRIAGVSPRAYQAQLRSAELRRGLQTESATVTGAIYQAGYSSPSRVYNDAQPLGMTPGRFRDGGRGETIRFATAPSPLGVLLVAATLRGVCSVMLGDDEAPLEAELHGQFPHAAIQRDEAAVASYVETVLASMASPAAANDLPLDIQATAFQARVWQALRAIPAGASKSYSGLAAELGHPRAVRAVARACATNPVAVAIPCHRVVGRKGALTGYRWGVERKRRLLAAEADQGGDSAASMQVR